MSLNERRYAVGLAVMVVVIGAYVVVVTMRVLTDGLPLTDVAWQGPMLLALAVGGGVYAASYGTMRWRARREAWTDERDLRIERAANAAGGGIASVAVLASLILLALEVETFWVAQTLLIGSALGAIAESATALGAYRGDVDA